MRNNYIFISDVVRGIRKIIDFGTENTTKLQNNIEKSNNTSAYSAFNGQAKVLSLNLFEKILLVFAILGYMAYFWIDWVYDLQNAEPNLMGIGFCILCVAFGLFGIFSKAGSKAIAFSNVVFLLPFFNLKNFLRIFSKI